MPELPEVEAARRAIEENCIGKKIVKAIIADDSKVIDGVSSDDFKASLEGKTILAANRKGKNMWIQLDSPPFPTFQFGMAGAIYIKGVAVTKYKRSAVKDDDEWPSKYSKVFLELDDGLELSFTDKRRFARVRLLENPVSGPPISELGPDALLEPMTADEFSKALSKKKIGIKALLLDQSFISGIGNWIADEVLYQARLHPMQSASSISKEHCATLLKCINEVTEFAVQVDADCSRFPSEWLFHYRWGKKPGKVNAVEVGADSSQYPTSWIFHSREKKPGKAFVDGKKIEFITAGGRTSAFVPDLQKNTGAESAKVAGKRQQSKVQKVEHNNSDGQDEEAEAGKSKVKQRGSNAERASAKKKSKESSSDSDENDSDEYLKKSSVKAKQNRSSKGKKDGDQKKKTRGTNTAAKRKLEESDDEDDDYNDASGSDDDYEQGNDHKLSSRTQSKGKKTTKPAAEPRQTRNKPSKKQK
ncbi:formamidopyrimidine-DNA glycosylase isoform X5 [Capsicum annuum]|uniref:formamidopyrimidine-DNA glycosylase isoform X5 n=1 Tax=Capsicum annuum TaxID=4072 RepID=UPI0007BF66F2|nr:formamidopyrimidine-DNA glycosylase isoform X5 [Capsicum annuum]